jgi:exoribonuclease-2
MLPPGLSQDTLSLKESRDRPAVSLLVRLDRLGNILEYRFLPSVIRVGRQLTYDAVNAGLKDDDLLSALDDLSRRLRMKRKERGALSLSLPELNIEVDAEGGPSFELVEQNTPSRIIVAEFMILYNWLAAKFCRENRIPVLFRTQAEPEERLSLEEERYLYYVFQQRRKLSPLKIDVNPDGHSGLGLDVYTQATSPIRRYLDLVAQRQIAGFLLGEGPVYTEKELEEIRMAVEPVVRALAKVKRNRQRYWVLKYLRPRRGMTLSALVLYELRTKYRLVLPDFLLIAEVKRPNGLLLGPGQEILVELRQADPWNDVLELAFGKEISSEK